MNLQAFSARDLKISYSALPNGALRCVGGWRLTKILRHNLEGYGQPRNAEVYSVRAPSNAADGLHRPTHERPGADSPFADPTQRWCSDCGKGRANVTGKSARPVGLHPSLALGPVSTEAATGWSGQTFTGHPADLMERTTA